MYDLNAEQASTKTLPIHFRMAESLRELSQALSAFPRAAEFTTLADRIESGGALHPEAYSIYFQLLRAVFAKNERALCRLVSAMAKSRFSQGVEIRVLNVDDFGRRGVAAARADFVSDSLYHEQIGLVPVAAVPRMRRRLTNALDLIVTLSPLSWQDMTSATTEILCAFGEPRNMTTFDGCSSLERYGSILINMKRTRTQLLLAETLVHESAHGLLFALSCDERRVLNPSSERHASPLRTDPRPLDGIYHAVFVLARMFSFVKAVAEHPKTKDAMRNEAKTLMAQRRKNFLDGYAVLEKHARLTQVGRTLIDDAYERVIGGQARLL